MQLYNSESLDSLCSDLAGAQKRRDGSGKSKSLTKAAVAGDAASLAVPLKPPVGPPVQYSSPGVGRGLGSFPQWKV